MGRTIFGIDTRYYCLVAFIGGVFPDVGHGLSLLTPKVAWGATHHWTALFAGIFVACFCGLVANPVRSKLVLIWYQSFSRRP